LLAVLKGAILLRQVLLPLGLTLRWRVPVALAVVDDTIVADGLHLLVDAGVQEFIAEGRGVVYGPFRKVTLLLDFTEVLDHVFILHPGLLLVIIHGLDQLLVADLHLLHAEDDCKVLPWR